MRFPVGKSLRFGAALSLVVIVVAVAVVGFWRLGYNQGGSANDGARIAGLIEYAVRDASGNIKQQNTIHNTTTANILNAARDRLGKDGTTIANTNLFVSLRACTNAAAGTLCTSTNLPTTVNNPIDNATQTQPSNGVYTAAGTFTATGAPTILTLQLTDKNATDASRLVGAHQTVSITLASGDTLAVTWTITIS